MKETTGFPSLLQYFFAQHLCAHKQVSPRTVTSYRDTFCLLLKFLQNRTGRAASSLNITDLDVPEILAFLGSTNVGRTKSSYTMFKDSTEKGIMMKQTCSSN